MTRVKVEMVTPADTEKFLEWGRATQGPEWKPTPNAVVLKAVDAAGEPIVFFQITRPVMLHKLVVRPDASRWAVAQSLAHLTQKTVDMAEQSKAGEVLFLDGSSEYAQKRHEDTATFAANSGFEKLDVSALYRTTPETFRKLTCV